MKREIHTKISLIFYIFFIISILSFFYMINRAGWSLVWHSGFYLLFFIPIISIIICGKTTKTVTTSKYSIFQKRISVFDKINSIMKIICALFVLKYIFLEGKYIINSEVDFVIFALIFMASEGAAIISSYWVQRAYLSGA